MVMETLECLLPKVEPCSPPAVKPQAQGQEAQTRVRRPPNRHQALQAQLVGTLELELQMGVQSQSPREPATEHLGPREQIGRAHV